MPRPNSGLSIRNNSKHSCLRWCLGLGAEKPTCSNGKASILRVRHSGFKQPVGTSSRPTKVLRYCRLNLNSWPYSEVGGQRRAVNLCFNRIGRQRAFPINGIGARKPLTVCLPGFELKVFKAKNRFTNFVNCSEASLPKDTGSTLRAHHFGTRIFRRRPSFTVIAPSS